MNEKFFEKKFRDEIFNQNNCLFFKNSRSRFDESNLWWIASQKQISINDAKHFLKLFMLRCLKNKSRWHWKKIIIIDVRRFNFMIIFDVYFLLMQFDIITIVKNCFYISVINCAEFFYQWKIHFSNKHKLIVINHREQKSFNVTVMNYKNSFVYIQRQIDWLFRLCRVFARTYINDIIIFSKNQQKHLNHLKTVF